MDADKRSTRFAALGLVVSVLMGTLGLRLWFLQAVDAPVLELRVQANKTRTVKLLSERGRIFDRDGRILADNERLLTVTLDWAVMRRDADRLELFGRLAPILDVSPSDMEDRYQGGKYSPLLPMPVKENVSEETAIYLIQRVEDFPGIDVAEEWRREYPYAPIAAHVLGYLGAISETDAPQYLEQGYNLNERVGQFGVERVFETYLRGTPGFVKYEVDSRGAILDVLERKESIPGNDLQLAIDLDLQQFAEQALETQLRLRRFAETCQTRVPVVVDGQEVRDTEGRKVTQSVKPFVTFTDDSGTLVTRDIPDCATYKSPAGSVVMMDYSNGQVLAMASYPTFDNRWFNASISGDKFAQIFPRTDDPDQSILVNRAIQGQYNLGSSFKPFVAYAALNTGQLSGSSGSDADYVYQDRGVYEDSAFAAARNRAGNNNVIVIGEGINRTEFTTEQYCRLNRCFYRNALCAGTGKPCVYGPVNVEDALAVSSDAFFYKIGDEIFRQRGGAPILQEEVRKFGFGSRTGVDLPFESAGRVPDSESKRRLVENKALVEGESPDYLVGDNVQLAIGQGLLAATPIQLAVAYGALGNGGNLNKPLIALALLEPGTPNSSEVGIADLTQSSVVLDLGAKNTIKSVAIPPEIRDPIVRGLSRVITGPGVTSDYYHSTTGERLFRNFPYDILPIAGKTGTAQGAASLPWNDSSVFAAFSLDPNQPIVVSAYIEKSGFGSRAAAPVVKCLFLAYLGEIRMSLVLPSNPLNVTSLLAAPERKLADGRCLAGANFGGRD